MSQVLFREPNNSEPNIVSAFMEFKLQCSEKDGKEICNWPEDAKY